MKQSEGFVLVNALILVAAMSAAALYLLSRAENGRLSAAASQQAVQIALYLDAGEALAITQLEIDRNNGPVDHENEEWAKADHDLELDMGFQGAKFTSQMSDMQGLFNINWLANPENAALRLAFDTLCEQSGIAPQHVQTIVAALTRTSHSQAPSGGTVDPIGGPLLMMDQLLDLPNITPVIMERLVTFATALPMDSALNVNSAQPNILAAILPQVNITVIQALTQSVAQRPFPSVDAFFAALPPTASEAEGLKPEQFTVGSSWFQTQISVQLQDRVAHRHAVLQRLPLPQGTKVAYRLENWN